MGTSSVSAREKEDELKKKKSGKRKSDPPAADEVNMKSDTEKEGSVFFNIQKCAQKSIQRCLVLQSEWILLTAGQTAKAAPLHSLYDTTHITDDSKLGSRCLMEKRRKLVKKNPKHFLFLFSPKQHIRHTSHNENKSSTSYTAPALRSLFRA